MKLLKILRKKAHYLVPILLGYIIYVLLFKYVFVNHSSCPIKELTGFPCPGCGLTRSYLSLFRGDIKASFYYHPLFWMIPILLFILIFNELKYISILYKSKLFWILIVVLFTLVYIIRMILYFPNDPMSFGISLIQKLFK